MDEKVEARSPALTYKVTQQLQAIEPRFMPGTLKPGPICFLIT